MPSCDGHLPITGPGLPAFVCGDSTISQKCTLSVPFNWGRFCARGDLGQCYNLGLATGIRWAEGRDAHKQVTAVWPARLSG